MRASFRIDTDMHDHPQRLTPDERDPFERGLASEVVRTIVGVEVLRQAGIIDLLPGEQSKIDAERIAAKRDDSEAMLAAANRNALRLAEELDAYEDSVDFDFTQPDEWHAVLQDRHRSAQAQVQRLSHLEQIPWQVRGPYEEMNRAEALRDAERLDDRHAQLSRRQRRRGGHALRARPRASRAARPGHRRRAGSSSPSSSADPPESESDPDQVGPQPRLRLAPKPRAVLTFGLIAGALERGEEVAP